jgi:hypothetical protein
MDYDDMDRMVLEQLRSALESAQTTRDELMEKLAVWTKRVAELKFVLGTFENKLDLLPRDQ